MRFIAVLDDCNDSKEAGNDRVQEEGRGREEAKEKRGRVRIGRKEAKEKEREKGKDRKEGERRKRGKRRVNGAREQERSWRAWCT